MNGPARREKGDEALFIELLFEKTIVRALVDTGASDCFMSAELRAELPESCIQDSWRVDNGKINLADNSSQNILEQVRVRFKLAESTVYYEFNVVDDLCHKLVLGRNLLTVLRTELSLPGGGIEVFCGNPISSKVTVTIPPGNECIIPVSPWKTPETVGETIHCTPAVTAPVIVEHCINSAGYGWWLKVMNPLEEPQTVTTSDVLAFAEECLAPEVDQDELEEFLDFEYLEKSETPIAVCRIAVDILRDVVDPNRGSETIETQQPTENKKESGVSEEEKIQGIDLSKSCLNEDQKKQFREMLKRNRQSLAFSMEELGQCEIAPMKIRVDESQGVVSSRPYRYSPQKMDIIDAQVRQLIDIGVIEPSESAWRSPLVVVQKKDGKPRLCTDFRMLNMLTYKDKFPMPTARSLFLYMAYKKPTIWSALDLLSGYHQCVIEEESRPYTAFETPMGVYQYRRVPFGLVGAPWQFTKVMAIALRGLVPRVCLAYLDDVIVYDNTFEEHVHSVELVLQALARAGLKLKPSKCEWCREEINFLGHMVNAEGVGTQAQTTEKIKAFKRPHNVKTIKSFLGLCNYYRSFVPNFAALATPLNKLLRKGIPFEWEKEQEEAFVKIRALLTSPPLLIHPDIGGHFHILTDASDTACGAAVCHQMNDIYRPIAFWGCTLRDAELNYTVTEKEALAVVKSLKNYEDMLHGAKVTIVTDHKPLLPLLQAAYKAPSARLRRWALAISDFDFEIQYEPGATHFLPDYLSRVHHDSPREGEWEPEVGCELFRLESETNELTLSSIIGEQLKDKECASLMAYLERGELPSDGDEARRVMDLSDHMAVLPPGVLCRYNRWNRQKHKKHVQLKDRMVVPPSMVARVLRLLHNDILAGGHVGASALTTKVTEKFYWRNMNADIADYVKACDTCALRRRAPHYKALAKSWDRPSRPWEVVQCDFIGPLKRANDGSRYIMTFIDLLTGWPEAFCTKDQTAKTAAEVFLYGIVCRYGKVDRLHTDRGATFLSDLFREITSRLACKQSFTTGRMPTGNARVERMHKTLENIISYYITDDHKTWPDLVPVALWTIRSTVSVRTGYSPHTLLFGKDPISMGLPDKGEIPESLNDNEFYMQTRDTIALFRHMADDVMKIYEKDLRDRIDTKARPTDFFEGDLVYMYDPLVSVNKQSKFSNRYTGPFRVIEVKGDHLVRLVSLGTGREFPHLVNISKIKRAYSPWAPAKTHQNPENVQDTLSDTEVDHDQPDQGHTQRDTAKDDGMAEGAGTENRRALTGTPDMTQDNTAKVPHENREESPELPLKEGDRPTTMDRDNDDDDKSTSSQLAPPEDQSLAKKKRKRGRPKGSKVRQKDDGPGVKATSPEEQAKRATSPKGGVTSGTRPRQKGGYQLRNMARPNYAEDEQGTDSA